jgi:hypothetical protein
MADTQLTPLGRLGRFDYTFKFYSGDSTYLTFNRDNYIPITELLTNQSVDEEFTQSLSHYFDSHDYIKREITELHIEDKNCRWYHIRNCTVQVFMCGCDNDLVGILVINSNKDEQAKALEKLEEIFA